MMTALAVTGPRIDQLNIVTVWHTLGGGPLRAKRGRAWFRDGDGFSISLNTEKGTWFDHSRGVGGGILALVEISLNCDRRAALDWLGENFGLATSNNYSATERRDYARRLEAARLAAAALVGRRDAYLVDLRTASGILLAEYHRLIRLADAEWSIDALANAEEVWNKLEIITGRRDRFKAATGPELAQLFAGFDEGTA